ncbi:O-antigen/teichoic acid export membrane protein [Edaphobacter modestus]|uniref:O-antigen/teichoic acid export membrane protein n=1 Tax=Edaphobacter modestus TaxID=388466 RepID=A0A4Q7YNF2_9BACT|nr:O-antigen/teichoic acid export membrane protein [Edaphobacter modestus]
MVTSLSVQGMTEVIVRRFVNLRRDFPFATNVAVLSGGASLGHLFTLAAEPILTRLYLPNDIGNLGLFNAFFAVAAVAASLQYDVAIVSAPHQKEAAQLAILAMLLAIPMSVAGGLLLYVLIHFSLVGFGVLPAYAAVLMVPTILFAGLFSVLRYWALRNERFDQVSQALIFQNGGRSVSQLALGVIGSHSFGLLVGEVVGRGAGMSRMLRSTWPVVRDYGFNFRDVSKALRGNRQFPLYSTPSSLLNVLGTSLPLPLLITLYGADAGGYYSLVWRVLAVPVVLIGSSMADAFHSRAALFAREDPKRLLWFFHSTTLGLLAMGIVPALAVFFYGESIFLFVFGVKWRLSGIIAAIVAPWFLTSFVVSPLSRLVFVLHGQRLKLIYDIFILGGNLLVFWFARRLDWPMLHMVTAMSAMNTGSKVVYYFVLRRIASTAVQVPIQL